MLRTRTCTLLTVTLMVGLPALAQSGGPAAVAVNPAAAADKVAAPPAATAEKFELPE
jgi:hypothetical protein